jgi:hypothetical protein
MHVFEGFLEVAVAGVAIAAGDSTFVRERHVNSSANTNGG